MPHLKITRPNSLLSVEIDAEISEKDLSIIKLVLASDITYGEALAVFGSWFDAPEVPLTPDYVNPVMAEYQRGDR